MADSKDKLLEYMIELNKNPDLLAKHNADPKGAAEAFGVSPEDAQLIADEKFDEIKAKLDAIPGAKVEFLITFHSMD